MKRLHKKIAQKKKLLGLGLAVKKCSRLPKISFAFQFFALVENLFVALEDLL